MSSLTAPVARCAIVAVILAAAVGEAVAFGRSSYGSEVRGDATYYGHTDKGHCALRGKLPRTFANMLPVSLAMPQYAGSASCGACIQFRGTGRGSTGTPVGKHIQYAYVHDSCHDCAPNDLDLSKHGDGRFEVVWKFIPCPVDDVQLLFEGSNTYYKKFQIRGARTPIVSASMAGKPGVKTPDNFFVAHGTFPAAAPIVAKDVFGNEYRMHASINVADGLVIPKSVTKNGAPLRPGPNGPPGASKRKPKCSNRGSFCSASRKCCTGSVCATVRWASSRRCVSPPSRCIPKWKFCSGPRKPNNAKSCCRHLVCRHSRGLRYKRCLPR